MAKGLGSVQEMIIQGIFPWCFTPELYAAKPDYIDQLAAFVRSRPKQPMDAFLRQSDAVIAHDASSQLGRITAPTQITFGGRDVCTSTRFADALTSGIKSSELVVFETCAHAPIYESVAEFNEKTLGFLRARPAEPGPTVGRRRRPSERLRSGRRRSREPFLSADPPAHAA